MGITALEIQQVGFEHSLRGYDVEQVDVFLEKVANEVDAMNKQISELTEQLAEAQGAAEAATDAAVEETEQAAAPQIDNEQLILLQSRVDRAEAALLDAQNRASQAEDAVKDAEARIKVAEANAAEAESQLAPLKQELQEKEDLSATIAQAFISAQRSADALKEEARAEGERIYREAEAKAREFIRQALQEKQRIINEIDALENSRTKFRNDYKKLLVHFTNDAENEFHDLRAPQIPDNIINELLPKAEDIKVSLDEQANEEPALTSIPEVPALTTEVIPAVVVDEDEDGMVSDAFDDAPLDEID